jgi:hypothetical protein
MLIAPVVEVGEVKVVKPLSEKVTLMTVALAMGARARAVIAVAA